MKKQNKENYTTIAIDNNYKDKLSKLMLRDVQKSPKLYISFMIDYFEKTGINPSSFNDNPIIDTHQAAFNIFEKRMKQLSNWLGKLDNKYLSVMLNKIITIEHILNTETNEKIDNNKDKEIIKKQNKIIEDYKSNLNTIKYKISNIVNDMNRSLSDDNKGIYTDDKMLINRNNVNQFKLAIKNIFDNAF